jgi:hypothetical protein
MANDGYLYEGELTSKTQQATSTRHQTKSLRRFYFVLKVLVSNTGRAFGYIEAISDFPESLTANTGIVPEVSPGPHSSASITNHH